jgi:hypothetical protein
MHFDTFKIQLSHAQALFLMRVPGEPVELHPFPDVFTGKNRTIELQIQGRFLRRPTNGAALFVGAEITSKMQLGMLKKALCNAILSFTRNMMVGVHYSFGDDHDQNGSTLPHELPHIVAPFVTSCDRLLVTPRNELPPPLGVPVPEPDAQRTSRRSGKPGTFDAETLFGTSCGVVTFSFNTMYVDLRDWVLCKIPMMRTMSLADFWGDADLQFVVYEASNFNGTTAGSDLHPLASNGYAAKLRIYRVENGHCPQERYAKSFRAEMERRPSFAMKRASSAEAKADSNAFKAVEAELGGGRVTRGSVEGDSEGSSSVGGDDSEAFDSCEDDDGHDNGGVYGREGEGGEDASDEDADDDNDDETNEQRAPPSLSTPPPAPFDSSPGSGSPLFHGASGSCHPAHRRSFSTGLNLRSRAAAAAAVVNTVAVASAMAASELRPRLAASASGLPSAVAGLHRRASQGSSSASNALPKPPADATAVAASAAAASAAAASAVAASAAGLVAAAEAPPSPPSARVAEETSAGVTAWRCVGWADLVDRPKAVHGKGPHFLLVATTTMATTAKTATTTSTTTTPPPAPAAVAAPAASAGHGRTTSEQPRTVQRLVVQRLVVRTAKECGPLLKVHLFLVHNAPQGYLILWSWCMPHVCARVFLLAAPCPKLASFLFLF